MQLLFPGLTNTDIWVAHTSKKQIYIYWQMVAFWLDIGIGAKVCLNVGERNEGEPEDPFKFGHIMEH